MNRYIRCVVLLLVCAVAIHLCGYGCLPRERTPGFQIEELLIGESAFPERWQVSASGPRPPANAPLDHYKSIDRIELFFYVHGGVANQQVHRFANAQGAAKEFKRQKNRFSSEDWAMPVELSYQSPIAVQFYLACGLDGGIQMCRAIGQYEEYYVRFNTHVSQDFMTYADLERILQAIDERMADFLKSQTDSE